MCGIYITNIPFQKAQVIEKLRSIQFRGPDNLGYEKVNNISLGHLRLSILDLDARSNQPYTFLNLKIVFNGEIYNFEDIKKELISLGYNFETGSDTEVLIKGFSEWGKNILEKLNGMFAFAIYDTVANTIFCARDRLGVKPFFYYWKDQKFEICSQLRPLFNSESQVSKEGISIYLDTGYIPSPYSILENVYKLPPGHFMQLDLNSGTKVISEYWNLKPVKVKDISYEDAKQELHELLIDAVKIRLQSDVALGSFLSGGIDSALVSAIAAKISKGTLHTFTIGFEDPKFDESRVAAQFSKVIGSIHTETICGSKDALEMIPKLIEVYDEPFADSSALPSLILNSITKKHVTVALSGDGGDESFLGYSDLHLLNKFNKIEFLPFFVRKFLSKLSLYKLVGGRPETLEGMLLSKDANDFSWKIFNGFGSIQKVRSELFLRIYSDYRKWSSSSIQRMADLNIKLWLENDSNVKVDRSSMAYSMEIRSPFLDYRVVEFARSLPVSFRFHKGEKKRILKDILRNYIPESIFEQPKKGFSIPLEKWMREDLKDDILSELDDVFLNSVPNLDVQKFKNQMQLHFSGKYDYSFNIWKLFILAKWIKEFNIQKI